MQYQRLAPDPGPVDADSLLAGLALAQRAPAGRPYTIANFIASADGRATLGGRSGALGDDGDRAMFFALRQQSDAVLVGTGTLRTERYGRIIKQAPQRRRRVARGKRPEPLTCIITRSGNVPADIPIFDEPAAEIVIFTSTEIDLGSAAAQVDIVRIDAGEPAMQTAMRRLREDYGVGLLLCEGGPTLFGSLLRERVVDELFLTLAPTLAGGGSSPTIASGPELPAARALRLEWLLEHGGSLYLRYLIG